MARWGKGETQREFHIDVGDAVGNDDKRRRQSHTKLTARVVRLGGRERGREGERLRLWLWLWLGQATYDVHNDEDLYDDQHNEDDDVDDDQHDDVVRCACYAACRRSVHSSRPTANSALGYGARPGDGNVTMWRYNCVWSSLCFALLLLCLADA